MTRLNSSQVPMTAVAETREYKVLFAATVTVFFFIALMSRLLPKAWRPLPKMGGDARSVYAEARQAADTVVPMAFLR